MSHLFDPLVLRDVRLDHRILVSPMCQYSAVDGLPNDWHFVHLVSRAVGGAAVVFAEATAVVPEGRITPQDTGLWSTRHAEAFARIAHAIQENGSIAGIQLAHAGRKASTVRPWEGTGAVPSDQGGWTPVAPSPLSFAANFAEPRALTPDEIGEVVDAFRAAAGRALDAGFRVLEVHAAHGYLLHEFLSPLSNHRTDAYGGTFDGRTRLVREVVAAVRETWPERLPLFVRISATDWAEGGWTLEESIALATQLGPLGVDLIDCSSGGLVATAAIPAGPGFQTAFAAEIRRATGIRTGAVGLITSAHQADHIVRSGQADCVLLARELLRDPYWPMRAAAELGQTMTWPSQYLRAAPVASPPRTPK